MASQRHLGLHALALIALVAISAVVDPAAATKKPPPPRKPPPSPRPPPSPPRPPSPPPRPPFTIPPFSTLPPIPPLPFPPGPPRSCPVAGTCSTSSTLGTPVAGFPLAKTTQANAAACATACKAVAGSTYYEYTVTATNPPQLPDALKRKVGDCACYTECNAIVLIPNSGTITSGYQASC